VTVSAKRKTTAPRKAAKPRTNGHATGVPIAPATEAELRAPERFEPTTTPALPGDAPPVPVAQAPAPIQHPYGDIDVYVFRPNTVQVGDSMDPIVAPHITTLNADVEFFWELDDLDPMHQAFRYMKRANIPRDIQRRVVRLPEGELARFLNGWFMGVLMPQGVGPPGES
jgi:hypothetical protein